MYTHQCCFPMLPAADGTPRRCNTLLRLSTAKDMINIINAETGTLSRIASTKWLTTRGIDHYYACHQGTRIAKDRHARLQQKAMSRQKAISRVQNRSNGVSKDGSKLPSIKETSMNKQAAQALFYIYCKGRISKTVPEGPYYRRMMKENQEVNPILLKRVLAQRNIFLSDQDALDACKDLASQEVPILNRHSIKTWVHAEFDLFIEYLRKCVSHCQMETYGNPIGQAIHDCGTLADKYKYLALGMQFVLPDWDGNMAVALSMARCKSGRDAYMAQKVDSEIKERTRFTFKEVYSVMYFDIWCFSDSMQMAICMYVHSWRTRQYKMGQL